jgi:phage terminase large subunit-like protein
MAASWLIPRRRVIAFVQSLKLTSDKYAGKKFRLRPWQKDIIRGIYRRDVKTAIVSLPRGQGKTQLCAGLMLAHLVGPESQARGELYSAAC